MGNKNIRDSSFARIIMRIPKIVRRDQDDATASEQASDWEKYHES